MTEMPQTNNSPVIVTLTVDPATEDGKDLLNFFSDCKEIKQLLLKLGNRLMDVIISRDNEEVTKFAEDLCDTIPTALWEKYF